MCVFDCVYDCLCVTVCVWKYRGFPSNDTCSSIVPNMGTCVMEQLPSQLNSFFFHPEDNRLISTLLLEEIFAVLFCFVLFSLVSVT